LDYGFGHAWAPLRKENPAVSTRTIFLLPIEFFKITQARKATAGKFWPVTTDTDGKFRPSGLWRETFYIPLPEKVTPENPGKELQIRPENLAASNCRYGRIIPDSNYQIRPENLTASNYRNGRKIPGRNTMNAIV
jgi:hypothetical protein